MTLSMKRNAGEDSKPQASRSKTPPNPAGVDYRKNPELYKVARGEQGVLTVEPYKSEILPHWRFRQAYRRVTDVGCCLREATLDSRHDLASCCQDARDS